MSNARRCRRTRFHAHVPARCARPQAPAQGAAVLAARLLRRGRARDRLGRAGARSLRRAGLRAARDRPQPLRGGESQGQGRDLRRGARRDSRYRGAGDLFRPRRAEVDSGRGQEAQLLRARCHLPAGHQGAPRGRDPPQARARDRADRPCRSSRGGRHDRPAPDRRHHAGAVGRRGGGIRAARSRQSRLCDADHLVGRRYRRHRRGAQGALSAASTDRTRRTSATPPPTARRWSRRWRRWSRPWSWSARPIRPTRSG